LEVGTGDAAKEGCPELTVVKQSGEGRVKFRTEGTRLLARGDLSGSYGDERYLPGTHSQPVKLKISSHP
jgi:hypothetical protein